MGISKTVTVVCDYAPCKGTNGGPQILTWNETDVEQGRAQAPELAQYLVLTSHKGVPKTFCCQLHAAEYFLPLGYEAKQKDVVELPVKRSHKKKETQAKVVDWKDLPQRSERPENGQDQPDGFGPEEVS